MEVKFAQMEPLIIHGGPCETNTSRLRKAKDRKDDQSYGSNVSDPRFFCGLIFQD